MTQEQLEQEIDTLNRSLRMIVTDLEDKHGDHETLRGIAARTVAVLLDELDLHDTVASYSC